MINFHSTRASLDTFVDFAFSIVLELQISCSAERSIDILGDRLSRLAVEPNLILATGGAGVAKVLIAAASGFHIRHGSAPKSGVTLNGLDEVPDSLGSPSITRTELDGSIKGTDPYRAMSLATAEVTANGETKYYVSVSGQSWKSDTLDTVLIDGKHNEVVKGDTGFVVPDPIDDNYNHAEQKLLSHIQDQYAVQNASGIVALENTSATKPRMCPGCSNSQNFANGNSSFDVTVFLSFQR